MYESTEILRTFVKSVQRLSGAPTVSIWVPASSTESGGQVLLHEGKDPLPELLNLTEAMRFHEETCRSFADADAATPQFIASQESEGLLLRLPAVSSLLAAEARDLAVESPEQAGQKRPDRRRADAASRYPQAASWLGLRLAAPCPEPLLQRAAGLDVLGGEAADWDRLLSLGAALAWHTQLAEGIPNDPTTGLPSRVEFQINLGRAMEQASATHKPLTLLLFNPDEFAEVNERFGREAGDKVVRDIADRVRSSLRSSDLVSKYGGAVFGAILTDTLQPEGRGVAEKLKKTLTEGAYLNGALRLGFSVGAVVYEPDASEFKTPLDLIRCADQALLTAKRSGGSRIVVWQKGTEIEEADNVDRLSGIFTANMTKDYRNMVLLWDTVSVIAATTEFAELARQAVARLYDGFKPRRVGLFRWSDDGEPLLVGGLSRPLTTASSNEPLDTFALEPEERRLIEEAREQSKVTFEPRREEEHDGPQAINSYAVPLVAGGECLGCLFIDGRRDALDLDASDLIFLNALASQLAVAFDRARLAEHERRRLQTELKELRQALQESRLLYRSSEMQTVIATIKRVAPTDVTVLITGESGTGKELLARTIHELSPRRQQPLVVVDCGAIAETLIDSELFGHEKGAYTGASRRAVGRLSEAAGGSVLLDEIGELPLEVQSKLLRFVQERQFTPVGGTRPRRVDVRVIAATNRDLLAEVEAGRFREDLYYRLNVVHLEVPALRDRPDDILYLATHWLEKYSIQYQKPVRKLSRSGEEVLLRYAWPGNVRELQNRIMQAVILSDGAEVGQDELRLAGLRPERATRTPIAGAAPETSGAASAPVPTPPPAPEPLEEPAGEHPDNPWRTLRSSLGHQIDLAVSETNGRAVPLGKWLDEDLVLEAHEAASGLFKGGAKILGIPEATFRRKVHKARAAIDAGLSFRSAAWQAARRSIVGVVHSAQPEEEDLLRQARRILVEEISDRVARDSKTASELAGVTTQTFRRWQAELLPEKKV